MPIRFIDTSRKDNLTAKPTSISSYQESHHGIVQSTSLLDIPAESLTHITSFLSPPSLLALSRTNRRFNEHINDDNTWYRAFINHFLGIGPENDLDNERILLLRKSECTWRKEFIMRHNLRRRWERSRNGTITHSPQDTTIDGVHLMSESGLLTSSIQYGVVARSLPLSGKVLKGYLDAAGTGLGIGNPNVEFTPNVSACSLTSDGGTARAFWGKRNGEVAVTTAARVMDPGRASSKLVRCKVEDHHDGVVNEIVLDPAVNRFVSGGADGQVKLWDTKTVVCLWCSDKQLRSLVVDPFLKVSSALADGIIAGALSSGDVILWTSSRQFHSDDLSSPAFFAQHRIVSPIPKGQPSPQDAFIPKPQPTVLCSFYRIVVDLTSGKYETTAFGDPSFGYNSITEPVFAAQPDDCSFIITGDLLGFVGIYDWDTPQTSSSVVPSRRFEAHEDGAVTALAWNSVVLATGSARGTATVWDALTLEPLRLFSSPVPRAAPGLEVGGVSKIVIEKELLVIIADNRVMSWKVGQVHHRDAPHKSKHARANRNPISKGQQRYDLHKVINESKRELAEENAYARHTMGREREQRSTLTVLGLSESEAVEYVLMLSREEEEHRRVSHTLDEGVFEVDFEDETFLPLASSSSTAHGSANQSSPSSLSDYCSHAYPRAARPMTNEKVQVSPVFVPEPMEAGVTISPLRIPTFLPSSSPGTRSSPEVARSTSSSFEHFPSISTSISSSTSSLERIRSAWSTPLRASFSSASMEIHDRWPEGEFRAPLDLDEMDDDLKFAIELSLAEARSRGEV
ncbi:WD40-repeat-containing domain protein [Suillus subalutaceus]|uniref:WD40-repeat-containing domain protein n=1 Tax=Suillus subalutaceus TaxID=48586 RepID=UPI001B8819BB|nr:WD40-repeat-containing domain protein [Suillus subalutaceus]KAG1853158.1 WD40-repeat-containing domain protein [Suillus subalutaceus]